MTQMILGKTDNKTISILFSDCIYSIHGSDNAVGLLQDEKNLTKDAFLSKWKNDKVPLATTIVKMKSRFDGKYYPFTGDHNGYTITGDRIFIISSIFGGTGASGFPLLRKLLHKDRNIANGEWGPIKNAPIGAITVLPYYNVTSADDNDNSSVTAQDWNDKAKAALDYYISEQNHLDTLYYIGDTKPTTYPHCKGGVNQTDPAHIVEMAAALSVVDFAKKATNDFAITNNGDNHATTYKEFGINKETQVDFSMLYQETQNTIVEPLSRFLLFSKYMDYNAVADNNPKQVKNYGHNL
ncbi:MAG: tubulin-like doman-containing protein [Candidatus Symbiothrix sp.]|jgi:hypothetical protein|nr:tubulin-like doman-containing protein [Candidatus Symbiothrix sp.]